MNNQAKFADSAAGQALSNSGSLSGQFRLADTSNRLKCAFWDAMSSRVGTFTDEVQAVAAPVVPNDPYGLLRFAHNGDSQLGTGQVRHGRRSIMSMVRDVRGVS